MKREPKHVSTQVELQRILGDGVSLKTIQRAAAAPGWPVKSDGRLPVAACREFLKKNHGVLQEVGGAVPDGFATWQEFSTAQKGMRDAVKLAKERGQVADKPFINQMLSRGYNQLFATQSRVFLAELPAQLAGLDAVTIETKLREALTMSHEEFKRQLGEWERQQA